MKITKQRLQQIIQEEIETYRASQINELDVGELEEAELYIKEVVDLLRSTYKTFFKSAAPAVGTPQTKADTGEPVTDQTAHEDAKGLLLELLGNAIDEFQQKESELNEDGHSDVPSAVRAMKTIIEDAGQMLQALEQMDGSLPTWWTNKMAVSASMLNKMRDYLLVPSMEEGKMTAGEKKKFADLEKKVPKKPFKDQYGIKKGKQVYYATLTKKAMSEGHGLDKEDIDYLSKIIQKSNDEKLKKILRFIKKSNIKVDKTKDLSKEKNKEEYND